MLRRLAHLVLAGGVLAVGVLAVVSSATGEPDAGLRIDDAGAFVTQVDPGSPTWRDGIRPGQRIVIPPDALDPGGWHIETSDGSVPRQSSAEAHIATLRHYLSWSVLALIAALLAALMAFRGLPAAAAVLPLAFGAAAEPLFHAGNVVLGLVAGVALFGGGALAVLAFPVWRRWIGPVAAAGLGLAVLWVATSTAFPNDFDSIDNARAPGVLGLSAFGFFAVVDRRHLVEFLTGKGAPAFVDVAYLSGLGALVVAAALFGSVRPEYLAVAAVIALAIYPFWRRSAVSAFERLVTSRARRESAIRAVEDERGRLAREIHDDPLQQLSGVIRRLERLPGAEAEAVALRKVAEGLRDVATTLHPPVLQDLGLPAAIADLGDHLKEAHPAWKVIVDVDDVTLVDRPPADVELAAFRVIQEATANALAHSGGGSLEIGGVVATDAIDLRASDDGHSFDDDDARDARRAGHFGLDAMRERAESVGASLPVTRGPAGVSVRFVWERR